MYHFLALSLSLAISVAALIVPRATPPVDWPTALLEPYNTYHVRYMALGCNLKHDTSFFDQCCHPLLANQTLAEARPAQCIPPSDNSDDGNDDCNGDATIQVPSPTTTKPGTTAAPTPVATPAPKKAPPPPASTTPAPQQPAKIASPTDSAANAVNSGGFATFFYQNGVAGACGTVHSDNDMIAAIDADRYGNTGVRSGLCGKRVSITNTENQHTVVVTIADACPTCDNSNSIDLSVAAFQELAPLEEGLLHITWSFV
ncbi:barwin-like endoglucanase [Phlegmacium glaucopus]|jgi:hypothetical protein|nr:barwin-like endoglucanase [Phlegmacium glaucopus]